MVAKPRELQIVCVAQLVRGRPKASGAHAVDLLPDWIGEGRVGPRPDEEPTVTPQRGHGRIVVQRALEEQVVPSRCVKAGHSHARVAPRDASSRREVRIVKAPKKAGVAKAVTIENRLVVAALDEAV